MDGATVKAVLRGKMGLSSSIVKRLKQAENGILLNGSPVHVDKRVQIGDRLELTLFDTPSSGIEPVPIPLDILYEDEDMLAVNKPPAMPTHPSQNHHTDTLANGIMYYYRDCPFTVRVITRLDKDTSGVVLIAKHALSAQRLSDAMREKKIFKEYLAAVNGIPNPQKGTISLPLGRMPGSVILRCVTPEGKTAITEYETLWTEKELSLVRLHPLTGRTHQLRVHMSHSGTPIYGDDLYGAPQREERVRLHCSSLSLPHPATGEPLKITAPLPEDIRELFSKQHQERIEED